MGEKHRSRSYGGRGCPYCARQQVSVTNSLAALYPELAAQWHPTKNENLTPEQIIAGSKREAWWLCSEGPDHEWEAPVGERTGGNGCPYCRALRVSVTNSLASLHPELAKQWHPTKNGDLFPEQVVAGSHQKVWWQCPKGLDHEWEASVVKRTRGGRGCPLCNQGWTLAVVRSFVTSLKDHLPSLTPAELYAIFQQRGLLQTTGKSRAFVKALATGRFPQTEIEKFAEGKPSLVDEFIEDSTQNLEAQEIGGRSPLSGDCADATDGTSENVSAPIKDGFGDEVDEVVNETTDADEQELPVVETKEALTALDYAVVSSADEEAIEFLLASATEKLWKHAFRNEKDAVTQAEAFSGGEYGERVREWFLQEYREAKELKIPKGYDFRIDGEPTPPLLMQRLIATRVQRAKRVGNWSGTGAGKTLSAVLASRVVGSDLTVICCPNSVVDGYETGWRREIKKIFPDSVIETKTFEPDWAKVAGDDTGFEALNGKGAPRYLILNYEAFQQPNSANWMRSLVEREHIDFIVVDEIHYTKQRVAEDVSRRRQLITALVSLAAERNSDLHVLGMSATPVINNLQEGKSLVELVTGHKHDDLEIRPTVPNCMTLYQHLMRLGVRWMPKYEPEYDELKPPVDCQEYIEEIRSLGQGSTPLALEQILTCARLPVIREHIQPKTLIYTHYIKGIDLHKGHRPSFARGA
ncbi:MAG: DEAD/DEAH box helicase family protein [Rubrobacter sp.]|nr:DEAD/DEAH box helicase family protein [Rubrobacter sp.]